MSAYSSIEGSISELKKSRSQTERIKIMEKNNERAMVLNSIQQEIFNTAEASGWHEKKRELPEVIALIHSEASEALEAYREGMELAETRYLYKDGTIPSEEGDITSAVPIKYVGSDDKEVLGKPEGIASEFADVIIRILDGSEELGIPTIEVMLQKMAFNKTRGYRHGGKRV